MPLINIDLFEFDTDDLIEELKNRGYDGFDTDDLIEELKNRGYDVVESEPQEIPEAVLNIYDTIQNGKDKEAIVMLSNYIQDITGRIITRTFNETR